MNITVRTYQDSDVSAMVRIWNEVVEEGLAFPQEENLTEETARVRRRILCRPEPLRRGGE